MVGSRLDQDGHGFIIIIVLFLINMYFCNVIILAVLLTLTWEISVTVSILHGLISYEYIARV